MKKTTKHVLFTFLSLAPVLLWSAESAQALIEARIAYGFLSSQPELGLVSFGGATDIPTNLVNYSIGADLLFLVPTVGLGFGARFENLGFKINQGGLEYKTISSRTSILFSYRILDDILYLGPVVSYGFSHTNNLSVTADTGTSADLGPTSSSSYSGGLEGGVRLDGFMLGSEIGFQSQKWNGMVDKNNVVASSPGAGSPSLDMSGPYIKVTLGFGI